MKKYDFAVVIGRFQPFHAGHAALFEHALSIADRVILILGSFHASRSVRNPWNAREREEIIRASLAGASADGSAIVPVPDSAYNFNDWRLRIQREVTRRAGGGSVAIVGHYKDDTSYYLDSFPGWALEALPAQADGVSSTDIRDAIFGGRLASVRGALCAGAFDWLERWTAEPGYRSLVEEYEFIRAYRKQWEGAPYPPTFVTADAVVFALGCVLLVRRKTNPGKGRLALPGGFVNAAETIERACLRELREETSLDVGHAQLRGSIRMSQVFDHPLRDPRGRMITHAFMFELGVKALPAVKAGDDAAEAAWFPLYRLEEEEENFFSDHAQIIKYFVNRMQ
ncbi:MAG: bifunctional nicotinamide-nucleotide adenylyltransferase/Nudix hydroxylase [Spirochaetales bacterium]|nr:bifunctional nicotinamide-nucleotide adenylyltransferase/Nudix hydroxylase [Spirochaetales bacterium]